MVASCDSCTGDCCKNIDFEKLYYWTLDLPYKFEYLWMEEKVIVEMGFKEPVDNFRFVFQPYDNVFLDTIPAENIISFLDGFGIHINEGGGSFYCDRQDQSGRCLIYENRPRFCRQYFCNFKRYKKREKE